MSISAKVSRGINLVHILEKPTVKSNVWASIVILSSFNFQYSGIGVRGAEKSGFK